MSSFHKSDGISLHLSSLNCNLDIPPSIETFWLPPFVSWGSAFFFWIRDCISHPIWMHYVTLETKGPQLSHRLATEEQKKKSLSVAFHPHFGSCRFEIGEKTSSNQHWPSSKQAIPSQFNCAELCWAYPFWRRFSQTVFFFRHFCWLFYSHIYTLELFLSFRYFFYSCERARVCRMAGPS